MAHEVFISYVSSDRDASEAVCAILEKNKIRCWLAPRDVLPGVTYGKAIIDAIATSRLLLLILSARSNESPHVVREVERAVHHEIAILPLRIEEVVPTGDMEFFLSATHGLDALPPPLAGHLARLAGVVQHLLRLEGVGPAEKGDSPGRPPEIRKERAEHPARDVPRPRIAAILGQWLSSSDTKLRAQAVDEIGKREMAEQAEALANVVRQDEKWALRVQALVVLRRLRQKKPEAFGAWYTELLRTVAGSVPSADSLRTEDAAESHARGLRAGALEGLAEAGAPWSGILAQWLTAPEEGLRAQAVEEIGKREQVEQIETLARIVRQDEKWSIRRQALVVLQQLRHKQPEAFGAWYPELLRAVLAGTAAPESPQKELGAPCQAREFRGAALQILEEFGHDSKGTLAQWLTGPDAALRLCAVEEIGIRGLGEHIETLARLVQQDEKWRVRSEALRVLEQFRKKKIGAFGAWYPELLRAAAQSHVPGEAARTEKDASTCAESLRTQAFRGLLEMGLEYDDVLAQWLASADEKHRIWAIRQIDTYELVTRVETLAHVARQDQDYSVRLSALRVLRTWQPQRPERFGAWYLELLRSAVATGSTEVGDYRRCWAERLRAEALNALEEAGQDTQTLLTQWLHGPDEVLRTQAVAEIGKRGLTEHLETLARLAGPEGKWPVRVAALRALRAWRKKTPEAFGAWYADLLAGAAASTVSAESARGEPHAESCARALREEALKDLEEIG